jgi:hypothetical protein
LIVVAVAGYADIIEVCAVLYWLASPPDGERAWLDGGKAFDGMAGAIVF